MLQTLKDDIRQNGEGQITAPITLRTPFHQAGLFEPEDSPLSLRVQKDIQTQRLEDQSGEKIDNMLIAGYASHADGYYNGYDSEEQKEKKKLDQFQLQQVINGIGTTFNDVFMTKIDISDYLQHSINVDQAFINIAKKSYGSEIKDEDMLRDKNGQIVKTIEEKRAMEEQDKACSMFFSQDEVTMKDGKLVSRKAFDEMFNMEQSIKEKRGILDDLDTGKLKAEDVSDDIKGQVAEGIKEKTQPKAETLVGANPTTEIKTQDPEQEQKLFVAAPKPTPAFTPAGP